MYVSYVRAKCVCVCALVYVCMYVCTDLYVCYKRFSYGIVKFQISQYLSGYLQCMCVCVCTHTHAYVYTHTHTHTHMGNISNVTYEYVCLGVSDDMAYVSMHI
jgi:hypothetical protein